MASWIKKYYNEQEQGYEVRLSPDFIDMTKTDFPDGLRLFGQSYNNEKSYLQAEELAVKFFKTLEEEYKIATNELKEISPEHTSYLDYLASLDYMEPDPKSGRTPWVHKYCDFGFYTRLIPPVMDLEEFGFSHGISIGSQNYRDPNEVYQYILKINKVLEMAAREMEKSL